MKEDGPSMRICWVLATKKFLPSGATVRWSVTYSYSLSPSPRTTTLICQQSLGKSNVHTAQWPEMTQFYWIMGTMRIERSGHFENCTFEHFWTHKLNWGYWIIQEMNIDSFWIYQDGNFTNFKILMSGVGGGTIKSLGNDPMDFCTLANWFYAEHW